MVVRGRQCGFRPTNSTPTPTATLELGLPTFGDVTVDADGRPLSEAQVIRDIIADGELADSLGVAARACDSRPW
jgi:hypothetical protein